MKKLFILCLFIILSIGSKAQVSVWTPLPGTEYGQNWPIGVWVYANPADTVTVEYAPWGTANYTPLITGAQLMYYMARIPTTGTYSLRLRNGTAMDSVMVNIISTANPFMEIISPQPGDIFTAGANGLDTVWIHTNVYGLRFLYGYILDANNQFLYTANSWTATNDFPSEYGTTYAFTVGGIPDTMECNNCKFVFVDDASGTIGVSDTLQIAIHGNSVVGRVYYDYNNSGSFDAGDEVYHNPLVTVAPATGQVQSNYYGGYKFNTAVDGQYTLTPPAVTTCQNQIIPPTQTVTLGPGNSTATADFRIVPTTATYDMAMDWIENRLMVHFGALNYLLTITNNGGTTSPAGTVTLSFDSLLMHLAIADPSNFLNYVLPTSYGPNGATFDVPAIAPCQSYTINMFFRGTMPAATLTANHISLSGYPNDGNPTNNELFEEMEMVAGVDPNDKQVDKKVIYIPELISAQKLCYTIRFQNTGNAPAYNIRLIDTLASNIDIASFNAISSSHPYTLVNRGDNVLEFRFNNIQLIDSTTDEPNSHGYVTFTVARPDGLQIGDVIENFADIYFDYNEPVRTNTATTQIMEPLAVAENKADLFSIYPNPANSFVQVKMKDNVSGKVAVKLYTVAGKLLQTNTHYLQNSGMFTQDISKLSNGVYLVEIALPSGFSVTKKMVVVN